MELFKKLFALMIVGILAISLNQLNIKNNASNQIKKTVKKKTEIIEPKKEVKKEQEVVKQEEVIEEITYHGLTRDQIIDKSTRMLNSNLTGTGQYFVDYSIERGVDPLLSMAIVLQETGCYWNCSSLVIYHNNVGGMRGSNGYMSFPSMNEGIKAYIDNLYNNYVAYGLVTSETMGPKYAEDPLWSQRVNAYIERIKAA